jgi:hypothetical protein
MQSMSPFTRFSSLMNDMWQLKIRWLGLKTSIDESHREAIPSLTPNHSNYSSSLFSIADPSHVQLFLFSPLVILFSLLRKPIRSLFCSIGICSSLLIITKLEKGIWNYEYNLNFINRSYDIVEFLTSSHVYQFVWFCFQLGKGIVEDDRT